jgi:hypothetical protein
MSLAQPFSEAPSEGTLAWQEQLLSALIEKGDVARAYRIWRRFAGVPSSTAGIFNPGFQQTSAPRPFNWHLVSGTAGVAEPFEGGVRLAFYGREDAVLASQLLVLKPGRYSLTWAVAGSPKDLLVETRCVPGNRTLGSAPLQRRQLSLSVPDECRGQRIEFRGSLSEMPMTAQAEVTGLDLVRTGGR